MIIVYTAHNISRVLAPCLLEKYPGQKFIYIHCMYFKNVEFDYPDNIKWKAFPYLTKPTFKIRDFENWKPMVLKNGNLESANISLQDILNCEKIIYAADPGPEESYLFSEFINTIFNQPIYQAPIDIDVMTIYSLAKFDILQSIDNMTFFTDAFMTYHNDTFLNVINKGKIKKYFDYNFNFNSLALLGKSYQRIIYQRTNKIWTSKKNSTSRYGDIFISKNMLQLLYFVRTKQYHQINYTENHLYLEMREWKGTGKYILDVSIGSAASRTTIISNLFDLELFERRNNFIFITEKGIKFLDSIPEDCIDFDLPLKMVLWSQQPFEYSKIKIDNYLQNYYQKIKNKLNQLNNF